MENLGLCYITELKLSIYNNNQQVCVKGIYHTAPQSAYFSQENSCSLSHSFVFTLFNTDQIYTLSPYKVVSRASQVWE